MEKDALSGRIADDDTTIYVSSTRFQVEAPFLPKVQGMGDTSNFESYPESVDDDCPPLSDEEHALFAELENF